MDTTSSGIVTEEARGEPLEEEEAAAAAVVTSSRGTCILRLVEERQDTNNRLQALG